MGDTSPPCLPGCHEHVRRRSPRMIRRPVMRAAVLLCCLTMLVLDGRAQSSETSASRPMASAPSTTLRIYLARHGETQFNAERRVQGQLDIPLNRRGLEQAEVLKSLLNGVTLDAIYTSPLSRNVTTAAIIADGRSVRVLSSLTERSQGRFQGLLADSAADFARRMTNPGDDLDGGETMFQLAGRARRALGSIRRLHPSGGAVLVVGHFLTNQMLLRELLSVSIQQAMQIVQGNDELYLVEISAGYPPRSWKLVRDSRLEEL
jgi:probable phosphoglycerate mutase